MQLVYYTSINATNQSNLRCVLQKRKKKRNGNIDRCMSGINVFKL